ncbi:hypothetical protein NIASO_01430 [Niabella soli DSM 19437]|uniref:Rhamnogalacturonase A/B/Epimerase-like pectate lyase domain-containing protein n=2 Tax=Niabella TaxID=379899 RepID=W0F206_9BACT|nr:hypothetical protein NIASO_01430 [Niabella soli DSM 19437]
MTGHFHSFICSGTGYPGCAMEIPAPLNSPEVNPISQAVINVALLGAKGDGNTDNQKVLNKIFNNLQPGQTVYFPKGNYLIDGPVIIKNKNNLIIKGDGATSRLFVKGQLTGTSKTTFFSTLSIDECNKLTIENLCIESKGENWGDADAASKFSLPDQKTAWLINKGGHALLITRSTNISVNAVIGRFCGSTGVFYASSCDLVRFTNCFANAASLGYAGFAIDNFANTNATFLPKRRYSFVNCKVSSEQSKFGQYAAKGGIVMEGDPDRILNCTIDGGVFENCYTGENNKSLGAAISAENTNLYAKGVKGINNFVGLRLFTRTEVKNKVNVTITNCSFQSNKFCGLYIASASSGGGLITINNSKFGQNRTSVWASSTSQPLYNKASAIISAGYMKSQQLKFDNCEFTGGNQYIYAAGRSNIAINQSRFSGASDSTMNFYGGGNIAIQNNVIEGRTPIKVRHYNDERSYSSEVQLKITDNKLKGMPNTAADLKGIPEKFVTSKSILSNSSLLSTNNVNNTQYRKITSVRFIRLGLQATNTFLVGEISQPVDLSRAKFIRTSNSQIVEILQITYPFEKLNSRIKVVLAGDVRKTFLTEKTFDLLTN